MATKSIGRLHATVTANATQFVNEFNRADNEARRRSESIRREIEKTITVVGRGFTLPNITKNLLSGLGLGSGFAVANTIFDAFAETWRQAKEDAKDFADYVEKALEKTRQLSEVRLQAFIEEKDPGSSVMAIDRQLGKLRGQLAAAETARAEALAAMRRVEEGDFQAGSREGLALKKKYGPGGNEGILGFSTARDIGDAISKAEVKAFDDIDRLNGVIEKWEKTRGKLTDRIAKDSADSANEVEAYWWKQVDVVDKALDGFFKPLDDLAEKTRERLDELGKKWTERTRSPIEKFTETLDELRMLREANRIGFGGVVRGRDFALRELSRATDPTNTDEYKRFERAAGEIKPDAMTRRGLGTGANYAELNRQTNTILGEIRELIRRALYTRPAGATFAP